MKATRNKAWPTRSFGVIAIAGVTALATMSAPAGALSPDGPRSQSDRSGPVADWIDDHAVPIRGLDRPGADLSVIKRTTAGANVVGLGEGAHALDEVTALKRRALEFLVERRGFRSLAWEDDWTLGVQVNDYIHGRRDDGDALVRRMSQAHRTQEVVDLLTWLRHYNETHHEDVSFVGVEYFATRPLAYDAVAAYVADRAPELVEELTPHLARTRPDSDDMKAHYEWYAELVREQRHGRYLRSAREVHRIVDKVPHRPHDRDHALALHHARQIRSWYTAFALPADQIPAYRDARAAENLRWWQRYSGDKVVYWAHAAHIADAPDVALRYPGGGSMRFAGVGSFLDEWYGDRYARIGYTFDRGTVHTDQGELVRMPAARPEWFEAPLGDVPRHRYVIDLDRHLPPSVRDWQDAPMLTRGDPAAGPGSTLTGSTSQDWYDVIVHTQTVSPATPLRQRR